MGCSVSVEVWIPGKGFAAVPSGVTFESRFEAGIFFDVDVDHHSSLRSGSPAERVQ